MDWNSNRVFSPTIASLIQLGAFDLAILPEDRQALIDEVPKHFPENCNEKIKVLGPICPADTFRQI